MTTPESIGSAALEARAASTRVLALVGPTAVGKSAVADRVALERGGEIVSADSMQVYRGMDVGTAKPRVHERLVAHHCLDLVDPGEPFSAALYQRAARQAIEEIAARGKLPVIVGGTGLYVRAALDDMEFPSGEQQANPARDAYEAIAAKQGAGALHEMLAERDPASAALIHPNNTRRVVRALEMLDSGVSYARHHEGFSARESIYDTRFVGLSMERTALYERIDARVDQMVAEGLLGEVETLLSAGLREALTANQAIGYKELVPVIEGGAALSDALVEIKRSSRRYAKRQLTWFRADPRIRWVDVTGLSTDRVVELVLEAID